MLKSIVDSIFQRFTFGPGIFIALTFFVLAMVPTVWILNRPGEYYGRPAVGIALLHLKRYVSSLPSKKYDSRGIRHAASAYWSPANSSVAEACRKLGEDHSLCLDVRLALKTVSDYESEPTPELKEIIERQIHHLDLKLEKIRRP